MNNLQINNSEMNDNEINKNKMKDVFKQLKEYHYKLTKEYQEKLNDSDSEEFWNEYVFLMMKNIWKIIENLYIQINLLLIIKQK